MERISFILSVDSDGKITVKNTMLYIMEHVPQVKIPTDMDIMDISLSMLTLAKDNTKKCVNGLLEGVTWNNEKCAYTDYKISLKLLFQKHPEGKL